VIILDTNVVSEPLKHRPNATVLQWLDRQSPATLYLTSISQAELLAGVRALPVGKRRSELQRVLNGALVSLFADRILAFGERSAEAYAHVVSAANSAGNPIHFAAAAIAAIAVEHNFSLATRNVHDYKGTSVELLDPWT
jgi:predicted nucleic acid-binding protein